MKKGANYFNFPIELLDGIFEDKEQILTNIRCYALYAHSLKLHKKDDAEYNFLESAKLFGVSEEWSAKEYEQYFNMGEALYNSIDEKVPKVGLNISIWQDYYKNSKTEFDTACLTAFLAIKSIIGEKPYCRVTDLYLWSRMNGFRNSVADESQLSPYVAKYASEYQTRKIKNTLCTGWHLLIYGYRTRGFFVSFKLTKEDLIMQVEKGKQSFKVKQYQQDVKNTRSKVLESLNKQNNDNM